MANDDLTPKELAAKAIASLPDDSTLDEIIRELLFHRMIEQGLADADSGEVLTHEEMVREAESWFRSSGRNAPPAA